VSESNVDVGQSSGRAGDHDDGDVGSVAVRPQRRRAPRGQGELLRDEILEATERLLLDSGGDEAAVSIRAVADAVGVTPPSIYLHFADKNELIFAVCEKHFAELDRRLQEAASGSSDPLESLRLRGRAYVRFGVEHPGPYRILFMSKPAMAPEWWTHERIQESASFMHLVEAVQACIDAGVIASGDPIRISVAVWAAVHGVTSLLISKSVLPWPDPDELASYMCDVLIEGLRNAAP
jgi:AcrR family transcriptional regulator